MARPRSASPLAPVSDCGIASPTMAYGRSSSSARAPASAWIRTAAETMAASRGRRSAKNFRRDGVEPAIGEYRFGRAGRARCVERAHSARAVHVFELPIRGAVRPGDRDAVIRRHQAVAGVEKLRLVRLATGEELGYRGRADLRLRIGRECRF